MDGFFKAIIEFVTNIFAALADFLGWTIDYDDLTSAPAEEDVEAAE